VKGPQKTVLERYFVESRHWIDGYPGFASVFGKPVGWLYVLGEDGNKLIRLDRKGGCAFHAKANGNHAKCVAYLEKHLAQTSPDLDSVQKTPRRYRCGCGHPGVMFSLRHLGRLKGYFILCSISEKEPDTERYLSLFDCFLQSEVELAYRRFELQNFYETVHPRALALSTIHSVHRVMASSMGLKELMPRIGRLCAQVLKVEQCDVYLLEPDRQFLTLRFSLGERKARKARIKVGKGIEGAVADTAEFHLSRTCIAVPFIEDDVVGIVALRNKIDGTPFTTTDLEILRTLSEQAVSAIKNAQLFEETQRLTVESIKTINELLDLSFSGDHVHSPLFGEIAFCIGHDLGLSKEELTHLHRATFLIDAGQMGTPERILHKSERLTELEYEEVKRHPSRGAAILQQISSLRPVIPIILHHHERFDGKGYPSKLAGEEIPIGGRIVAVVDSFTAMLSRRPYRKVRSMKEAVGEIKANAGTQFDPKVVESFLRVIAEPALAAKLEDLEGNSKGLDGYSVKSKGDI